MNELPLIDVNLKHIWNASSPIVVMPLGRITSVLSCVINALTFDASVPQSSNVNALYITPSTYKPGAFVVVSPPVGVNSPCSDEAPVYSTILDS